MCVPFLSWSLTLNFKLLQVFCHCTLMSFPSLSLMRLKSLKCPRTSQSKGWKGITPTFLWFVKVLVSYELILNFFTYFCFKQRSNILLSFSPKSNDLSHSLRINISTNEIRLDQLMASTRVQNCEFSMASQVLLLLAWKKTTPWKLLAGIRKIKGYY